MKSLAPETVRLMQAAVDTRDSLRRLAARIQAAGDDQQLQAEALEAARHVAITHSDMLRMALKDSAARRHSCATSDTPPWALTKPVREL